MIPLESISLACYFSKSCYQNSTTILQTDQTTFSLITMDHVPVVIRLIVWKNFTQTSWPIQQQLYLLTSTRQTKNIFIDLWHRTQLYYILLHLPSFNKRYWLTQDLWNKLLYLQHQYLDRVLIFNVTCLEQIIQSSGFHNVHTLKYYPRGES